MLYLDSSALVKLVRREPESEALADWLDDRYPTPWVASALVEVELVRAVRRTNSRLLAELPPLLERVVRYEIGPAVREAAAAYPDALLRSLDAIHLATAAAVLRKRHATFVTYDDRLARAARFAGLTVAAPR